MSSVHQGFQPDATALAATEAIFGWLDQADKHPLISLLKERLLEICPVNAGDQVLDVGCGLGHEARRLAHLTGPQGRVAGVDSNPAMISEASRRAAAQDLPVSFEVGDAHHLPFADASFDVCRTERVLRYVDQVETVLAEMVRVTRSQGTVLAFDFDEDMTIVDAPDMALTRRVADLLNAAVPHPWIGRQLFAQFQRAGLQDIRVVPHAFCLTGAAGFGFYSQLNRGTIEAGRQAGQLGEDEAAAWWAALEEAAKADAFFVASLGFIVTGTKP